MKKTWIQPTPFWLLLFAVWMFFLSGVVHKSGSTPSTPGISQALALKRLMEQKQSQLLAIESQISELENERQNLLTNRFSQEREIRKVLGYASRDELIFDFSQ